MNSAAKTTPDVPQNARLTLEMARLMHQLAQRNGTTFAVEVRRAAILLLRKEKLLPEPGESR